MSKNILLWSGYGDPWGVDYWKNNGIGGSEYSLLKLAYYLKDKGHNITVGGDVEPNNQDGICWGTIDKKHYDIVIAINYIHFYQHLLDNNINFDEAYFWMHNEDYHIGYNGEELSNYKWVFKQPKFKKVIGVSKTHADKLKENALELFNYTPQEAETYIDYIDNAIDLEDYKEIKDIDKIPGRIIWTSSADRGLDNIIENWSTWKLRRPDLSLVICSPPYAEDWFDKKSIEKLEDVEWLGPLDPLSLKTEIAKAEYWIYLSDYFETYCISALEMMMGKVKIITTAPGNILNLIDEGRGELLKTPYEYRRFDVEIINVIEKDIKTNYLDANVLKAYEWAKTQNWENRVNEWCKMLDLPSSTDKKIIDCFTFYNEFDLLDYRLNILDKHVDYFILVESTHTFVGKEKPLLYNENKELFKKFNHKIIHIIVDDFPHKFPNINFEKEEQWVNENFQRNCISRGLDKINLNDEDIITITDLDEIPNPKLLNEIKENKVNIDTAIIEMDFYYYNLNSKMDHQWHYSKITSYKNYIKLGLSLEQIRQNMSFEVIKNAGWHLSYFMDENLIKNKIINFAHQEYNNDNFININKIKERINNHRDLFDRPIEVTNIDIKDNDNLPPYYDIYLQKFYTHPNKNIAFFIRHFDERGTGVAIYDYANYNENLLNNKSYIIHFSDEAQKRYGLPDMKHSFKKFNSRFELIEINDINDMKNVINKYKLDVFYTLTYGGEGDIYKFDEKKIWGECKTIKHCVFDTTHNEADHYISIADFLNKKYHTNLPVIQHMIDLPNTDEDLRNTLNIPKDAIILGRYGGFNQFDLQITHDAISDFLNNNLDPNVYFLFMNTDKFYEHPNIIYLEKNTDLLYKTKFINTCDAMIHARSDGEIFSLAIAEFSTKNKPIITCPCGDIGDHIPILGDKAITYNNTEELLNIFSNIKNIITQHSDWNCYKKFTPENIMNLFSNIFKSQSIKN